MNEITYTEKDIEVARDQVFLTVITADCMLGTNLSEFAISNVDLFIEALRKARTVDEVEE